MLIGAAGRGTVVDASEYRGTVKDRIGGAFTNEVGYGPYVAIKWDSGFGVGCNSPRQIKSVLSRPYLVPPTSVVLASDVEFNEGVLRLAAAHKRPVEFRYAKSASAPIETRSFVPESVRVTNAGHTVFAGEDPDRDGEYRSYRLDRIKGDVSFA